MLNAGLVQYVVVDDFLARFWASVLPGLKLHPEVALRSGAQIAWAIRKNSPLLKAELDEFLARHPEGSASYNMLFQKYLKNTKFVKNSASEEELKKFQQMVQFFKTYSDKYDMDYLLMAAQGFQESQLNQNAKSKVGAVGVMQVMPATGQDLKVGDISQLEPNIHAGVKYMRFMIDQYFEKEPMDKLNKGLFAFAVLQRRPGPDPEPAQGGGEAGPRSEQVVQQRRDRGLRKDRPGDRDLRREHLQVLRRLQARDGERSGTNEGARRGQGLEVGPPRSVTRGDRAAPGLDGCGPVGWSAHASVGGFAPCWSICNTSSSEKLPAFWLGGNSLNVARNCATYCCAGTRRKTRSIRHLG